VAPGHPNNGEIAERGTFAGAHDYLRTASSTLADRRSRPAGAAQRARAKPFINRWR
jgi:hypothetical protein